MIPFSSEPLPAEERSKSLVNLRWLVRVRWMSTATQIALACLGVHWGGLALPCEPLILVFGLSLFSNLALHVWASRFALAEQRESEELQAIFGVTILLDTSLLTLVLALTGGPSNPFTVLYLVHIVLSTILLPSTWSMLISVVSVGAFLGLFFWHVEVPGLSMHGDSHQHVDHRPPVTALYDSPSGSSHGHDAPNANSSPHQHTMGAADTLGYGSPSSAHSAHLWGMFLAFALAASFITWYVQRIMRDLQRITFSLEQEKQRRSDAERLRSLGTLAAGAAHELATPLSTIRIIASELKRSLDARQLQPDAAASDLQELLNELERCRRILEQMRASSGDVGVSITRVDVPGLVDACVDGLPGAERIDVNIEADGEVDLPLDGVAHAIRSVLSNALQAGPGRVDLIASIADGSLLIEVRDAGAGMSPQTLARFTEPFFTTRPEGAGMGLGAYLARRVVEDLGGSFAADSVVGKGTTVHMQLPVHTITR